MKHSIVLSIVISWIAALSFGPRICLAQGPEFGDSSPSDQAVIGASLHWLSDVSREAALAAVDSTRQFALDAYRAGVAQLESPFEAPLESAADFGRSALDALTKPENIATQESIAPAKEQALATADVPAKPQLSPELEALDIRIKKVLDIYRAKELNTAQHGPWEIMHRIVAYGISTQIRRDGPDGEQMNAIGWLLEGGRCNSMQLLMLDHGVPEGRVGPGVQGHPAQFLAMLAQAGVSAKSPFRLEGKSFTVADLIRQEKLDCSSNMELTFKLVSLPYYLDSDDTWTSREGQTWSIARLVQEEIRQPIRTGACGGTHRLFGLSSAYIYRARQGKSIEGQFLRAQTYIHDYQRYTLQTLQNPDGSFSTEWFTRPANADDPARKIQTTGHMLEWLVFSLADNEIRDPAVIKSVNYLTTTLGDQPNRDWSVGPLGHALHALVIYDQRLQSAAASSGKEQVAKRTPIHAATAPRQWPKVRGAAPSLFPAR